ncbi:MAG: amidohydrolase family protein [Anaerolineae bacterium]|nr:amidohydrolase family protein [Anaerolineae bacterium]
MTNIRLPGLADIHVHLRVPGGEHKEDIRSGTAAALAGGFTTILAMPNTSPPLTQLSTILALQQRIQSEALCDVHLFAGASPENLSELRDLSAAAAGLKLYLNQTYGPLRVDNLAVLLRCFQLWPCEKVIAMHAEGSMVAVGLGLAACYNHPVHFCHVSRKDEIELIALAKSRGLPVTCEVTPHHLFLTDADAKRLGPLGDMRPVLASQHDVDALWTHMHTTVDCVATDHAPHTLAEKHGDAQNAPPGVPGLETALPLMLTAVHEGRLSMERLVDLMHTNPRRIFGLPLQPETWVDVDPKVSYTLVNDGLHTKCGWSPFSGFAVTGRINQVCYRGHIVIDQGCLMNS